MGMPVSEVCLQRMSGPSVDLGFRHAPCECASASSLNIGRIRALVMRGIPWRGITLSGASSQLDTKSPQPRGVCGLAWNSGVAGIRSVAVGLARTLRVGELVELVDVGLGNHDVDGGEHASLCKCARVGTPPGHTVSLGSCHIHSLEALRSFNRLIFDLLAL